MTMYIATLNEVKENLGIPSDDSEDDIKLRRWLEGLQGRFDTHCRRILLYAENQTEYMNGDCSSLFVHRFPIDSIVSINIDPDMGWAADTLLDSDAYRVNNKQGQVVYGTGRSRWTAGFQNIRVIYTGGFVKSDGTAAPYVDEGELQTLKRAFFMQGEFEYRNREQLGISQVSAQGVTVQQGAQVSLALKGQTFLPEVQTTLTTLVRYV